MCTKNKPDRIGKVAKLRVEMKKRGEKRTKTIHSKLCVSSEKCLSQCLAFCVMDRIHQALCFCREPTKKLQ